ncbi:MAG TPA: DUF1003 domain-containing protein [Pyrinomonadaceae bacterium]|jgi:uncharacterized membrane protein
MSTDAAGLNTPERTISGIPMFRHLEEAEVSELAALLQDVSFKEGEVIFHEHDPGDAMYILRSGSVRIWTHDEDVQQVTLAELEAGSFFGELAVLDGSERSATAEATSQSTLSRLSRDDFHRFMLAHPVVALDMIREIGTRLRQTNQLVSQRVTRNINTEMDETMTLGQKVADKVASFGGSWPFIFLFGGVLITWIALNLILVWRHEGTPFGSEGSFDPYPFIALNLILSMTAAFQAPIIMMSQNRAGQKDRLAAEIDFKVNLKSELMLENLTRRIERLQNEQMEELLEAVRKLKTGKQRADEGTHGAGADAGRS